MAIWKNENTQSGLNALELAVSDSGYATLNTDWHSENVCSPYSRLYLVESGEGLLEANHQPVVMRPGFVYLVPPGLRFSYSCSSSFSKLFFHVSLLKPNGYDLFQSFGRIGVIPLEQTRFQALLRLYRGTQLSDTVRLKLCLYEILDQFITQYAFAREDITLYSRHVWETIRYIQSNLSARLSVQILADRLFVSKSFLSDKFRGEVGVPLGKYIDDQLMAAAQWQLLRTDASIGEISNNLGFCDQFYFSRRFKQLCGETPLQYRKKIRAVDQLQ